MTHVQVTREALDPGACADRVRSPANGAVALFLGTVRDVNDGRRVEALEYASYEAMAERELAAIVREAAERFGTRDIAAEHRVGRLELGDVSVVVAAAHPHRGPAFDACRYVIEELKRRVPIWKREHYADGTREWVDPTRGTSAAAG